MKKSRRFWFVLVILTATVAPIVFLWGTDVRLGVPGEWTWDRIPVTDDNLFEFLLGWLVAGVAAGVYVGFAWLGARRLPRASRTETAGWLCGLVAFGFAWLWIIQECPPSNHRMSKAAWVLYYPRFSGYFYEVRISLDDVGTFLAGYEAKMKKGDVLHVGTHPPGLFLFYRGLLELCRWSPGLTRSLLATRPDSVREAFSIIDDNSRPRGQPLLAEDQATIWLAALITQFAVVATVVPLFILLRRSHSPESSWAAVTFWPLLPSLAIFLPKSDALYPVLGMAFLLVWLQAMQHRSVGLSLLAGMLFWFGMLLSLAFLPIALLAGLLALWEAQVSSADQPLKSAVVRALRPAALSLTSFLAATAIMLLVCDVNLFNVWKLNYQNHANFYQPAHYPRTYWKWLLVNPLELIVAAGMPLIVLAASSYSKPATEAASWRDRRFGPAWCCLVVWGLLWLSGKNMGEAARLWIPLMPWLVWISARIWDQTTPSSPGAVPRRTLTVWVLALILQAVVCAATVTRVDGFDLTQLATQ